MVWLAGWLSQAKKLPSQVGEPRYQATAQSEAGSFHFLDLKPPLSICIVALSRADAPEPTEAPDNKYLIVNYFMTKVAACSMHIGHRIP